MSDAQSEPAPVEIDPSVFRRVLGHFPTGVTVVASQVGDRQLGLAIGSFFSVSLDPPLVGFCVATSSGSWPHMAEVGSFGVSVLADDQHEMSNRFASKLEDKFEGLSWEPAPVTGSPLIHDAVAHLDCDLHDQVTEGDHVVVIGRVRALEVHREEAGPLLFFRGAYGRHEPLG